MSDEFEPASNHVGEVFRGTIVGQPIIEAVRGGAILTFPVDLTEKSATGSRNDPQFENGVSYKAQAKLLARRQDVTKGITADNLAAIGYYGTMQGIVEHQFKGTVITVKGFEGNDQFPDGSWFIAGWRNQEPLTRESVKSLLAGLEGAHEKGKDRKAESKKGVDSPF